MIQYHGSSKGSKTERGTPLSNLYRMLRFAVAGLFFSSFLVQGATQSDSRRSGDFDSNAADQKMSILEDHFHSSSIRNLVNSGTDYLPIVIKHSENFTNGDNYYSVCDEVTREEALFMMDNSLSKQDDITALGGVDRKLKQGTTFYCNLSSDTVPRKLEMLNLKPDFEDEWRSAKQLGKTLLVIEGGAVYDNSFLIFPNVENDSISYRWVSPPSSSRSSTRRKLAGVSQLGEKSVLVFRVKVTYQSSDYTPSTSAADASAAIFGDSADPSAVSFSSQFADCSYGKLNFIAASVSGSVADGVIDIAVTVTSLVVADVKDAVDQHAEDTLGLDLDAYDYLIYLMPKEVTYQAPNNWLAHADTNGKRSFFNDTAVVEIEYLMHEIAHNLGLLHASDLTDSFNTEYGDLTGHMGYKVINQVHNLKCFNAAKSYELGWYTSPNRVVTIQPSTMRDQVFQYNLIGVADYGKSYSNHTLILEIEGPSTSEQSVFLTYNTAKGINAETGEAQNKVPVVSGLRDAFSFLNLILGESESHTFPDYYNGRGLVIQVGSAGTDGYVDYIDVTVYLESTSCSTDTECQLNASPCNVGTCNVTCSYTLVPDCCGDGYCDANEHCSNCPQDCSFLKDCNELDCQDDEFSVSGLTGEYGIMLNVEAFRDVGFYEIEADVASPNLSTYVNLYTKIGNYSGFNNLGDWKLCFNGTLTATFGRIIIPFAEVEFSTVNSTRAFYITYQSSGEVLYDPPPASEPARNTDIELHPASLRDQPTLNQVGDHVLDALFLGGLKYTYETNLIPIPEGELGSVYFSQGTYDWDEATHEFDEDCLLLVSLSKNGRVMAVSGVVSGTSVDKYVFKVLVYKKSDTTGEWELLGSPITNDNTFETFFAVDARADISLSGDGKRLAISSVYKVRRPIINVETAEGFVKVYTHSLEDNADWQFHKTVYEGNAGSGGQEIGLKVSLNQEGNKLLIGEMYYDANGNHDNDEGRVQVYDVDSKTQVGSNVAGVAANDYAGSSVAIARDVDCFIYGAIGAGDDDSGVAYVYCWDTDDWALRASISGEGSGDDYGHAVSITSDGTYIVVGAHKHDVDGEMIDAGHVRVYCYNGTDYIQLGSDLDGVRGEKNVGNKYYVGDAFGFDVGISDLNQDGIIKVIVGAPNNQDAGYYFGQIGIFQWKDNFSTEWEQVGPYVYGEKDLASIGNSVAIESTGSHIFVSGSGGPGQSSAVQEFEATEVSTTPSNSPSISIAPSSSPSSIPSSVPTSSPSMNPSSVPTSLPSVSSAPSDVPSFVPSLNPSKAIDREFEIRTTYDKFDFEANQEWCVTAKTLSLESTIVMRKCNSENHLKQVWKRTEGGQIKLSRPSANFCLKKYLGLGIRLGTCAPDNAVDPAFMFDLDDTGHDFKVTDKDLHVGFDVHRMFSKLRLYKNGSLNPMLSTWETHYDPDDYD